MPRQHWQGGNIWDASDKATRFQINEKKFLKDEAFYRRILADPQRLTPRFTEVQMNYKWTAKMVQKSL
jgi:hypothetical protein